MKIEDFNTSYSKLKGIYQVQKKDNVNSDNWHRVTYPKNTFENMLKNNHNLKDSIKPMPYRLNWSQRLFSNLSIIKKNNPHIISIFKKTTNSWVFKAIATALILYAIKVVFKIEL